ncbi:MAG: hypothetical protein RIS64_1958 [Bacteroidota bacterium]
MRHAQLEIQQKFEDGIDIVELEALYDSIYPHFKGDESCREFFMKPSLRKFKQTKFYFSKTIITKRNKANQPFYASFQFKNFHLAFWLEINFHFQPKPFKKGTFG